MLAPTPYDLASSTPDTADCSLADLDYPTCYLCGVDGDETALDDAGFPSSQVWVCGSCQCGYVHQQALRDEYELERSEL